MVQATVIQRSQGLLWEHGEVWGGRPPGGGTPPPGLSYAHMWPEAGAGSAEDGRPKVGQFVLRWAVNGGCCRIKEVGAKRPSRSLEGCKRGKVKGFTHGSRFRMLELLNSIDRERCRRITFVTLTVPRGDRDFKGIERDRRLWMKRFERRYKGRASIVWKKEAHASGTPHLHMLIFWWSDPPSFAEWIEWNDRAWAEVVNSPNHHQGKYACKTQVMRSWNGVMCYAAKYLGKGSEVEISESGRIWGVHNRALLCMTIREEVTEPEVGKRERRTLRKLQERKKSHWEQRVQKKDGTFVWIKIKPENDKVKRELGGHEFHHRSVEDQLRYCRRHNRPVRYVKGRALSRRVIPIWAEVTEQSMCLGEVKRLEKIGDEVHSFSPALHFVSSADVERLHEYWKRRVALDLVLEEDIPF